MSPRPWLSQSPGLPSCAPEAPQKHQTYMAVCQNLVPLVNIKIAGKWMFIPLKMVLIGIDPYPYRYAMGQAYQLPKMVESFEAFNVDSWEDLLRYLGRTPCCGSLKREV